MARGFRPFARAEGSGYFPRKAGAVNGVSRVSRGLARRRIYRGFERRAESRLGAWRWPSRLAAEGALADAGRVALEVDAAAFVRGAAWLATLFEAAQLDAIAADAIEPLLADRGRPTRLAHVRV